MRWRIRQVTCNEAWSRIALLLETSNAKPLDFQVSVAGNPPPGGFYDPPTNGLFGPTCPYTRTLKTGYPWKQVKSTATEAGQVVTFLSEIPETCLWEPIHPFLYDARFLSGATETLLQSRIGVRTVGVSGTGYLLNGIRKRFHGLIADRMDAEFLKSVRPLEIEFLWDPSLNIGDLSDTADEFGPFVIRPLPANFESALSMVAEAGPTRPSIGIWLIPNDFDTAQTAKLKVQDPATVFARRLQSTGALDTSAVAGADLLMIDCVSDRIAEVTEQCPAPVVAVISQKGSVDDILARWSNIASDLDRASDCPNCIGWLIAADNS